MQSKLLFSLVAGLIFTGAACAHSTAQQRNSDIRSTATQRGDGIALTKKDARNAGMSRIVKNFEKIDINQDGVVTRDELYVYALSSRRFVPMT